MSRVFIINAGEAFGHSFGKLNATLAEFAQSELSQLGHEVKLTNIADGYDIENEINHFLWADVIIYQQPAWWMGAPWTLKKYIDEVFTAGHQKLYASDGRSRTNPNKNYGKGGLLQGRHYMISATWNAPEAAFDDADEFFEGKGFDAVYFPFHKANQFIGLAPLESFSCHDVIKSPSIESDLARYKTHLQTVIK
ncbi:NAD(P)H-dependent oxidoreductase [Thorsellia anophelis]|uniref:Modulator of drug activity B n=1 Tax=Thorsellia anophelis DSM 18579 TaxID=1123402 RepID=A0A1I0E9T7_9GAMM|nr:NAD(P)H-dependent oxidoreductase [Thorsellia anophelis]SET41987.1 modulator of drug activity B [Thorsellia anophelis DSM 18579]